MNLSIGNYIGSSVLGGGSPPADDRFIITVKTDNAGTSTDNQFTIPTNTTGITQAFLYDIETSDGQTITGNTGNHTITFPSAGTYDIYISGSFPYMRFNLGGDRLKLLDIKNFGIYALGSTNQDGAFYGCSNMDISANDIGHFENVTNIGRAWRSCSSLTYFPPIDTSSVTTINRQGQGAWHSCSSLTSFPLLDLSNVTNFQQGWIGCSSLTSFPLIDTSSGTSFSNTWNGCSSLISFPLIDTSNGTDFQQSWLGCSSLANYPANAFDTNIATNYTNAFLSTNLTTQSIDDILVSLDTSGVSNGTFTQSGGQAPSATGEAAIDSLVGKGWTITVTGGYTPPQLLLDEYPNAAAAYSLRDLASASVGSAVVRVRRSSDNAEQDFTATEITDGTLTTFTGANDGFVAIWYDQSGNSNNASQATATKQPQIVDSGAITTDNNGNVGVKCVASETRMPFDSQLSIREHFFHFEIDTVTSYCFPIHYGNGWSSVRISSGNINNYDLDSPVFYKNGQSAINGNSLGTDPVLYTILQNSTDSYTELLGYYYNHFIGYFNEYIGYATDQSSNRTGIETNINNHYTIY